MKPDEAFGMLDEQCLRFGTCCLARESPEDLFVKVTKLTLVKLLCQSYFAKFTSLNLLY